MGYPWKRNTNLKGVSFDKEVENQKEGEEKPNDMTYVMEDPRYNTALKVVTQALESLLNVKISLANIDHMENVVKIIISLCIDFSIKTENIQENMLAMGVYIRDFQKTKEKVEETKNENERLEKEIMLLNNQISSLRKLYNGYREVANTNVISDTVQGSVLVERMVEIEEEKKKLKKYAESMELKYSQAFGRKNEYKDKYLESERNHISYKKKLLIPLKSVKKKLR